MSCILLLGAHPKWHAENQAKGTETGSTRNDQHKVEASLEKLRQGLAEYRNISTEQLLLFPGDETSWNDLVSVLKKRKFDGIALGGGMRTIPWLSDYFTELMIVVTEEQPQATLLFPLMPDDVLHGIKKFMPQVS